MSTFLGSEVQIYRKLGFSAINQIVRAGLCTNVSTMPLQLDFLFGGNVPSILISV